MTKRWYVTTDPASLPAIWGNAYRQADCGTDCVYAFTLTQATRDADNPAGEGRIAIYELVPVTRKAKK